MIGWNDLKCRSKSSQHSEVSHQEVLSHLPVLAGLVSRDSSIQWAKINLDYFAGWCIFPFLPPKRTFFSPQLNEPPWFVVKPLCWRNSLRFPWLIVAWSGRVSYLTSQTCWALDVMGHRCSVELFDATMFDCLRWIFMDLQLYPIGFDVYGKFRRIY